MILRSLTACLEMDVIKGLLISSSSHVAVIFKLTEENLSCDWATLHSTKSKPSTVKIYFKAVVMHLWDTTTGSVVSVSVKNEFVWKNINSFHPSSLPYSIQSRFLLHFWLKLPLNPAEKHKY